MQAGPPVHVPPPGGDAAAVPPQAHHYRCRPGGAVPQGAAAQAGGPDGRGGCIGWWGRGQAQPACAACKATAWGLWHVAVAAVCQVCTRPAWNARAHAQRPPQASPACGAPADCQQQQQTQQLPHTPPCFRHVHTAPLSILCTTMQLSNSSCTAPLTHQTSPPVCAQCAQMVNFAATV